MAAIKAKDTTPERKVRKALHALGFRFRLHDKKLPGKPDLVLTKYRTVVFVHGCFWHKHTCKFGAVVPATRAEFWAEKRNGNVLRDETTQTKLQLQGWRVLIIWECETKDSKRFAETISQVAEAIRKGH